MDVQKQLCRHIVVVWYLYENTYLLSQVSLLNPQLFFFVYPAHIKLKSVPTPQPFQLSSYVCILSVCTKETEYEKEYWESVIPCTHEPTIFLCNYLLFRFMD
jgi:hypothetical protein